MTQQQFQVLAQKYLEGRTSEAEEEQLMEWMATQPTEDIPGMTDHQKQAIERSIWQRMDRQIRPFRHRLPTVQLGWISGIAACLLLGLFGLFMFMKDDTSKPGSEVADSNVPTGIEIKNTTQAEQAVRLKDGTIVWLKAGSSVVYDKNFNQTRRTVYLSGEAFFQVKRDTHRPFIVHAGALVTEVLGTSFRIKPKLVSKEIEVSVATGRVSVYTQSVSHKKEHNGVILTPNQRATFNPSSLAIIPSLVENPQPIPTQSALSQTSLVFQGASLQTVLTRLEEVYGIQFVVVNPDATNCLITADLTDLSLFAQLDLVCKSIEATYERRGTEVFITGEGC